MLFAGRTSDSRHPPRKEYCVDFIEITQCCILYYPMSCCECANYTLSRQGVFKSVYTLQSRLFGVSIVQNYCFFKLKNCLHFFMEQNMFDLNTQSVKSTQPSFSLYFHAITTDNLPINGIFSIKLFLKYLIDLHQACVCIFLLLTLVIVLFHFTVSLRQIHCAIHLFMECKTFQIYSHSHCVYYR